MNTLNVAEADYLNSTIHAMYKTYKAGEHITLSTESYLDEMPGRVLTPERKAYINLSKKFDFIDDKLGALDEKIQSAEDKGIDTTTLESQRNSLENNRVKLEEELEQMGKPVAPEVTVIWADDATKIQKVGQESVSFGKTPERVAHNNPRLSGYIYEPIETTGIRKVDLSNIAFADFKDMGEVRYYGKVKVRLVGTYETYHTREGMVYRTFDKNHKPQASDKIWDRNDIPASGKNFPEAEYHLTTKFLGNEAVLTPFMPAEVILQKEATTTPPGIFPSTQVAGICGQTCCNRDCSPCFHLRY